VCRELEGQEVSEGPHGNLALTQRGQTAWPPQAGAKAAVTCHRGPLAATVGNPY
jgi:hypothetical protein